MIIHFQWAHCLALPACDVSFKIVRFNLLDYFLWGYAMSLAYADKPEIIDTLEERVIADIRSRAILGGHLPEIILKT